MVTSKIRIISKKKTTLKDRIKEIKDSVCLKPTDFDYTPKVNNFEMNGKIIYLQY